MRKSGRDTPLRSLGGRLGTPRLRVAGILLAAVLVAAIPSVWWAGQLVDDATAEIEGGRLRLAQLAASQADRLVTEAFFEIELMASALEPDSNEAPDDVSFHIIHGHSSSFSAGVMVLDEDVQPTFFDVPSELTGPEVTDVLAAAAQADDRTVSRPWLDAASGRVLTALGVPVYDDLGDRAATLIGLFDLTDPLVADLIQPAARLGTTGHADLVDERGLVLASTDPGHVMSPGDHPAFYEAVAETRMPTVARVPHNPEPGSLDRSERHIMAYAPLQMAPWGVAMGTNIEETFATVNSMRHRLYVLGLASIATLLAGGGLALLYVPKE